MDKGKDIRACEHTSHQQSLMPTVNLPYNYRTSFTSINSLIMIIIREAPTKDDKTPITRLWLASFLKVCHSVLKPLSKIRQGKKRANIALGWT